MELLQVRPSHKGTAGLGIAAVGFYSTTNSIKALRQKTTIICIN